MYVRHFFSLPDEANSGVKSLSMLRLLANTKHRNNWLYFQTNSNFFSQKEAMVSHRGNVVKIKQHLIHLFSTDLQFLYLLVLLDSLIGIYLHSLE